MHHVRIGLYKEAILHVRGETSQERTKTLFKEDIKNTLIMSFYSEKNYLSK